MKTKLKSLLLLAVMVPFFFSCNNDDDNNGGPTITFDKSTSTAQVTVDGTLIVKGSITSKEGTTIESVVVKCLYGNGSNTEVTSSLKDLQEVTKNNYTFIFTEATKGIKDHLEDITGVQITATVKNGDENTQTWGITPYSNPTPTNPLEAAKDFTWERKGGGNGTGLEQFGLAWTANTAEVAIVKKQGSSVKFVELSAATWSGITTKEDLKNVIDVANDMNEYRGISVIEGKDYNVVLGVRNGDTDYILHITRADVATSGDTTIKGQYKK